MTLALEACAVLTPVPVALVFLAVGAAHAAGTAPAEASAKPEPKFEIGEYRVLGNSVLDTRTIERAVYSHLGPQRTLQDVEAARAALETAYHEHGYGTVFVDIPEQSVDEGIVRLHVTQGRLHASTVSGARYFSERQIKLAVPEARVGNVPSLTVLQSQLSEVNAATPDRRVVPVLKAGPDPGTMDLALKVNDRLPLHGSLEVNDQHTPDTKPLRVTASLSYDNLFGRLDSGSFQYQFAPQASNQVTIFGAGWSTHFGSLPGRWSFTFLDNSSSVSTLGAIAVVGKGKVYEAQYSVPVHATQGLFDSLSVGIDYKDFAQSVQLNSTSGAVQTPIHYASLSLGYSGGSTGATRQWSWSGNAAFGIRGLRSDSAEFANKCYQCRADFYALRLSGSVAQRLPGQFVLSLRAAAQGAVDPLISNEQYLLGGAATVRGYLEAEELGDIGANGSAELRAPNLLESLKRLAGWELVPFGFYDAGEIRLLQPLPGEAAAVGLRSAGAGLSIAALNAITGTVVWADPFVSTANTRAHEPRWQFFVRGTW